MRVAVWSGSIGESSTNQAALKVAARWLANAGADVEWVRGLGAMPNFNPDLVERPPLAVANFRTQIDSSDAVLIATPEYAGGLAGLTKNALDWLVGSGSLYQKLAGVLSVGTSGGINAREQLVRTLSWQGALTVADLGIEQPRLKMAEGDFTDVTTIAEIEGWVADVVIANRQSHEERLALVMPIILPLGIDPERFG